MLYLISQKKGEISAVELSKMLELQKSTCQNFKNKITERLKKVKKTSKLVSWDRIIIDTPELSDPGKIAKEETV